MFPVLPLAAGLQSKLRLKWVIVIGFVLICTGTALLPFADSADKYWRFGFPGFLLGTAGASLIYTTTKYASSIVCGIWGINQSTHLKHRPAR
jgi:uncharacterized membrane protein